MLKNGQLYGSIIPPEVNSLRIRDISLGEKVSLQLIALTEHPVGKIDRRTEQLEKEIKEAAGGTVSNFIHHTLVLYSIHYCDTQYLLMSLRLCNTICTHHI